MRQGRHFDGVALPAAPHVGGEWFKLVERHVIAGQLESWRWGTQAGSVVPASAEAVPPGGDEVAEPDDEEILRRMIRYAAAGLRALPEREA